ncbi:hypothetical protein [Luteibacter yeojuensis]|uniref:Histidine kinase n=1 Tax=Luteibacter yeojuensis TaxID=345309 RepID=A0A7X5QSE8_9GAMM|nr:hypothetical protein [Luteibacter yeojuensis]NID14560.1 hypothetical protein [Luteibacter yeojuensis]
MTVGHPEDSAPMGDALFRREAAHALSAPLGGLMLQAELADRYLEKDRIASARDALATLSRGFETFGTQFRAVFAAMADIAEEGGEPGDPRECLAEALARLREASAKVGYRGVSPRVAMSSKALRALMRHLAMLASASGAAEAELAATTSGHECVLSLTGPGAATVTHARPFDSPAALHFLVVREIAARHGGRVAAGNAPGAIALVVLPVVDAAVEQAR